MNKIEQFKNREVKAKQIFTIKEVDKMVGYEFIKKYHYLKDAKYFSMYNYGLFIDDDLVGLATYSLPQGTATLKGWFGLPNNTKDIMELMRLCVLPELNGSNATSFLLGRSIKKLKKDYNIRAVVTLADSSRHVGSIYQVCNFTYYGLTDKKTDFYREDGKKNPRGSTKDSKGVWIERTRKHRYAFIIDSGLECNYTKKEYPKSDDRLKTICCNGSEVVHDKRFDKYYSCPLCTGELIEVVSNDSI